MKTIGIDLRIVGSRQGGIGRYSFEIAKEILSLDRENKYIVFLNKKNLSNVGMSIFESFSNVVLVDTKAGHYSFAEQTSFLRQLNKYRFDLVYFTNFYVPLFYAPPFLVTIHDIVHH